MGWFGKVKKFKIRRPSRKEKQLAVGVKPRSGINCICAHDMDLHIGKTRFCFKCMCNGFLRKR